MQNAIASYEKQMDQGLYKTYDRTKLIDYNELKNLNKNVIKDVTETFKKTVIGDTWQESLAKIESEISEKFLRIKTMFERENNK